MSDQAPEVLIIGHHPFWLDNEPLELLDRWGAIVVESVTLDGRAGLRYRPLRPDEQLDPAASAPPPPVSPQTGPVRPTAAADESDGVKKAEPANGAPRRPSKPESGARPAGRGAHDDAVLEVLAVTGPLSANGLARRAEVPLGSISSICGRLERNGKIERDGDRRWRLRSTSARPAAVAEQRDQGARQGLGDLGPIERRPFDPERARDGAGDGL